MQGSHAAGDQLTPGLALRLGADGSLTRRLATGLRLGIQDGSLPADQVLPPSRVLAAELGCSRWVVTEAYGQLVAEGYLSATTGSATRVRRVSGAGVWPQAQTMVIPLRPRYDLLPGTPDLAAFPRTRWAEAYRRAVLDLPTDVMAGRSLVGSTAARATLADYLRRTRQVQENLTQLSLTTGTTVGATWLFRVLAALGHRRVAGEDPSWPAVREAAHRAGLQPVPIPVDEDGLVVSRLSDHDLDGVRVAVVTPAHQFPHRGGVVGPAPTRADRLGRAGRRVDLGGRPRRGVPLRPADHGKPAGDGLLIGWHWSAHCPRR